MAYEINKIVYDTDNQKLGKLLEAIRQRQKQSNPFRIKVNWVSGEFKPYEGYITHTEPFRLTEYDEEVSFPLLAWNRRSTSGKRLDPALIESIEFSSKALRDKHKCDYIFVRATNYFHSVCAEWLADAIFLTGV